MSDEIIGFNRDGAEQYKKIAREVTRRMQNETPHRARWQQQKGGGGGAKWIRFIIVSSDPTTSSAIVNIRQRSFTGVADGSSLSDTVIDSVYDTAGCYLNEINVDLTGRSGFAMLMLVDNEAEELHFGVDGAPQWYWMVTGICCPSLSCS